MATISDFKIVLKDKNRDAFKGNTNDYYYGYQEDGFSIDYRQAVWNLTSENIADVKKKNAKFEFILMGTNIGKDEYSGPTLAFIWQDPVRGLWWQDDTIFCGGDENDGWKYKFFDGASWEDWRNKITLDLSKLVKDSKFAAATELNFIVACWWNGQDSAGNALPVNISDIGITGATIVAGSGSTPTPVTITLKENGEWGWQETYSPATLLNGVTITEDVEYTFTYSFKSDVAMDYLQVVFIDNHFISGDDWSWDELSTYYKPKETITANTVYSGTVVIKATKTAANATPEANRLVFQAGTGTASAPTLTFTALSIAKKN